MNRILSIVGPRSTTRDFYFRDLEITSKVTQGQLVCGIWKSGIDFPIVFIVTTCISRTIDFHIRDLQMNKNVIQGQRSWRTFTKSARMNIFVHRHPGPRSNRLNDTGHFHFRDIEVTLSWSSEVKLYCGFWRSDLNFPIVFHSNHMLISHHQEHIGNFHIRDFEMTPKGHSRSKVKMHFY